MSMKDSLIAAGIEPATFRFVAQHLNHCATAVPSETSSSQYFLSQSRETVEAFPSFATLS